MLLFAPESPVSRGTRPFSGYSAGGMNEHRSIDGMYLLSSQSNCFCSTVGLARQRQRSANSGAESEHPKSSSSHLKMGRLLQWRVQRIHWQDRFHLDQRFGGCELQPRAHTEGRRYPPIFGVLSGHTLPSANMAREGDPFETLVFQVPSHSCQLRVLLLNCV